MQKYFEEFKLNAASQISTPFIVNYSELSLHLGGFVSFIVNSEQCEHWTTLEVSLLLSPYQKHLLAYGLRIATLVCRMQGYQENQSKLIHEFGLDPQL